MKTFLRIPLVTAIVLFSLFDLSLGQTPPKKTPELLKQGKTLYEKYCVTCHGIQGDGTGALGTRLKPPAADFTKPFDQWGFSRGDNKMVFIAITDGVPNTAMAKFRLSVQERWALAYAVIEFTPK